MPVRAVLHTLIKLPLLEKTFSIERIPFKCKKNFNCFTVAFLSETLQAEHLICIAHGQIHDLFAQTQCPFAFRAKRRH